MESEDEVVKSLFVEAFHSREVYIESVMVEFDETDKLEKMMSSGPSIKVPGFIYDDDDDTIEENSYTPEADFDINNCVLEVSELVEDLDEVDKTSILRFLKKIGTFVLEFTTLVSKLLHREILLHFRLSQLISKATKSKLNPPQKHSQSQQLLPVLVPPIPRLLTAC